MLHCAFPYWVSQFSKKLLTLAAFVIAVAFAPIQFVSAQSAIPITDELMQGLLPGADTFSDKTGEPPVYRGFKTSESGEQQPVGFLFETPDLPPEEVGYSAPIHVLVAMDLDGIVTGIEIINYRESYRSIRGDFLNSERFPNQFFDKSLTEGFRVGRDIDGVSRATISSWAVSRGIRNAARRVAEAYMDDVAEFGIDTGGALDYLGAMDWEGMRDEGMVSDLAIEYTEDSALNLSFMYMGTEQLGEMLVGVDDYSVAERESSNRTQDGTMMLVGISGNSNSSGNPFRPERLAVEQDGNFFPLPRSQFVYAGSGTDGKIANQVNFAGAIVLNMDIDFSQPFLLHYDTGSQMGQFDSSLSTEYQMQPVLLAHAQGIPWVDPTLEEDFGESTSSTGLARLIDQALWGQVFLLIGIFALVMTAFLRKDATVRWLALGCTLIYLGWWDGGFLSISHVINGVKIGPSMFLNDAPILLLVLFTLITTLLFGRVFCSSLCPFGALQDFITRFVPKRFQFNVPQKIHDKALYIKYGILVLIFVMAFAAADISIFQYFEPFGTVFFLSRSVLLWSIAILFLLGAVFIKRFYCRYVCPLGAALGVISLVSPFRIKRVEQCDVCKVCEHACPTGAIRGPEIDFKECVRCDLCEIKLNEKAGVCKHNMEDVRSRLKGWEPVTVS